jgi:hypothetical protein
MAEYEVTLETGEVVNIDGRPDMTDEEIGQLLTQYMEQTGDFAAQPEPEPEPEPSAVDHLKGAVETLTMLGTGAMGEVVSGGTGILGGFTGAPEDEVFSGEEASQVIADTQEMLTYQPRTEAGRRQVQWIGEKVGPILEWLSTTWKEGVADPAFEATESPMVGAAVGTLPTAAMEIAGVKGARGYRRATAISGLRNAPLSKIASLYDETGALLPIVEDALRLQYGTTPDKVGLARRIDPREARIGMEEAMSEKSLARTGEQIGTAATRPAVFGGEAQRRQLAAMADPDEMILKAAQELGVDADLLPSHFARNPTYVAIEQGLKSVPASDLSVREAGTIAALAEKADEFIVEFGGDTKRADVSENFRLDSQMLITELEKAAEDAYDAVRNVIPADAEVVTSNTLQMILDEAEALGGIEFLDKVERGLLETLDPKTRPTYKRIDRERKKIGQALSRSSGPYKDADEGALKRIYGALREDQRAAARAHGAEELYESASGLVAQRKSIEEQLVNVIGKEATGDIQKKAGAAVVALAKGETEAFTKLLKNIPEMLGKESRREIVMTAMNDALTMGSRKEKSLHIPGFDDFMNGIKKNGTDAALAAEIFNLQGLVDRAYGVVRGTARILPGTPDFLSGSRVPRHLAADALLADRQFLKYMVDAAAGRLENKKALRQAATAMRNNKAYQKWLKTLGEADKRDVLITGVLNFMRGKPIIKIEKEE